MLHHLAPWMCATLLLALLAPAPAARAIDTAELEALFANPSRDYSSGPLWVWNDMLTEDQIRGTLRSLAGQKVMSAFVHPRPGLMTPYLSEDWFRLWKVALDEAERLDMNIWIYDENSYPSGFAGGYVPEAMPEARGLGVEWREHESAPARTPQTLALYLKTDDGYTRIEEGTPLPDGVYLEAALKEAPAGPWFGGTFYVDLLQPGVTHKFLEITMDAYKREVGEAFGKRLPGVFTDEPHLSPAGGPHWTGDLPQVFQARWGYNLLDQMPSLKERTGDWKAVRHHYYQTLLELFIDRWSKPYFEYCAENGIEFTGHYWEHGWPGTRIAPDNMAMYAWMQRPGIDTLFNQYSEGPQAQFGNVRAARELGSVANQLGLSRTLCEAYGGSGWDVRFEDLKRIGDWLYVHGINTLNQHLSHITLRGARKADYPVSFSYHAPWWPEYHVLAQYFARLSAALSQGHAINSVLLLEPTTTAWMYQDTDELAPLGEAFQNIVTRLAKDQIEFDIGCEDIMADHGRVEGSQLIIGKQAYHTVVISPRTENLNPPTADLLEAFLQAGGIVLDAGHGRETRIDGAPARWDTLTQSKGWRTVSPDDLTGLLRARNQDGFVILPEGDGILYHMRRDIGDGQLLFLVNTSIEAPISCTLQGAPAAARQLDPETGEARDYPWPADGVITLPPAGSLLLVLGQGAPAQAPVPAPPKKLATSDLAIERLAPNVLTLDYITLATENNSPESLLFYEANAAVWKKHGFNEDPWDHAVQFRDNLISKTFSEDSGFEAEYRFTIEGAPPTTLHFVIERPDLYTLSCNGHPLQWDGQSWWLDKAFGKLDISAWVQPGENVIALAAHPFTMYHELAPAYVLGDFALRPADSGFVITPAQPLQIGPWKAQGLSLYGDAVAYEATCTIAQPAGSIEVALPEWRGAVAAVEVNGASAGSIYRAPWTLDITSQIHAGENTVRVIVYGTPKNPLGPHHDNPPLGFAGPGSFRKGPRTGPPPGEEYSTLDYGLFQPFELCQR